MRLWASYSTLGPLGLLGAENAPAFQVLPLALRRQVLVRHRTCSLIELCAVQEKDQVLPGRDGERDQLTDRRGRAKVLSRVRPKQGWLAQRSLLPEAARGTRMLMSGQGSEWLWEMGTGREAGQRSG